MFFLFIVLCFFFFVIRVKGADVNLYLLKATWLDLTINWVNVMAQKARHCKTNRSERGRLWSADTRSVCATHTHTHTHTHTRQLRMRTSSAVSGLTGRRRTHAPAVTETHRAARAVSAVVARAADHTRRTARRTKRAPTDGFSDDQHQRLPSNRYVSTTGACNSRTGI